MGRVHAPERQRKTERQKVRNHPPEGMAIPQSLLLHSPLRILGTHMRLACFKSPSTMWESSDIAITLTAGSLNSYFCVTVFNFPDIARPGELLGHLVWCWSIPSGFCLSDNVLVLSSHMKDRLAGYSILG